MNNKAVKAKRKTVKFAVCCNKVRTLQTDETSDSRELWLSKQDYRRIAKERDETVQANALACGDDKKLNPDEHTVRGIERYAYPTVEIQRITRMKLVMHSVLVQQRMSKQLHTDKDKIAETIRDACEEQTAAAQEKAVELAKMDEMAACLHQGWQP